MKSLLLTVIALTFSALCFGQAPQQLTKADSVEIENTIISKAEKLKDLLQGSSKLSSAFTIDTFKIEERQRLKLDIDYSTNGMVSSALDAGREYDKLLNKYYRQLLNSLNKEDKEILKKSQRNWIKFRDSELEMNETLTNDYYSGGGTIQRVFAASRVLEITKNRVLEIYDYLDRKAE